MKIEILGPGCPKCRQTESRVRTALSELGKEAEVVHVYDLRQIAQRKVMMTPAVAVDGQVKVAGHVPTVEELKQMLA